MRLPSMATALILVLSACSGEPTVTDAPPTPPPTRNPSPSTTIDPTPSNPAPTSRADVQSALDITSLREHLETVQRIADDHAGNRATGTPGFDASATYVTERLRSSGYVIDAQRFVGGMNLIAERVGATSGVVMIGAHLDSVRAGPGMNDNGSGVAALLTIAETLATLPPPEQTIRFAFWDAEEGGPFGSTAYVDTLSRAERDRIRAYLNLDMIGSPNAIRLVYAETGAAAGSDAITRQFAAYFDSVDLRWSPIDLEGDSDHGPFTGAGIPTGGLFSGGIEPVTDDEAERFGAVAGSPADACSHQGCDTLANVDLASLEEMTRAVAHVLVSLALD
ncbi:MAG: M20/M25/M40 family metallo-hydrolase [Actinomycetota bacterium]|nr:M20/M25/M40 family metallo-hydrolase [Actinomycetota bacterium]